MVHSLTVARESRTLQWIAGAVLMTATVATVALRRRPRATRPVADETRRVRDLYDREAARYDSMIRIPERLLFGDGRIWAASQATGDVLEIAVGTGRNLRHYTDGLRIVGQDISLAMLEIARSRATALGRTVHLHVSDAQALPFPDEQFDSVVGTLSLCTIPDERRALMEIWRVLRPAGRVILLEHVRSRQPLVRMLQRLIEPLAVSCAGDHLLRDPLDHLVDLGFSVEFGARSRAGIVERIVARKESDPAASRTT
jgi:ubiquinone/menaquinone biosynthesis C-methylase UbiE